MLRMVWLALFCLAAIIGLAAVRSVIGSNAPSRTVPAAIAADVSDAAPALPKGDRLPSRFFDKAVPAPAAAATNTAAAATNTAVATTTPAVAATKVAPVEAPKQPSAKDDIVSWHWHQGSKVVRRRKGQ